jgi:hypothetical protein
MYVSLKMGCENFCQKYLFYLFCEKLSTSWYAIVANKDKTIFQIFQEYKKCV